MVLTMQIALGVAAGILFAFVVIFHPKSVFRALKWVFGIILTIVLGGLCLLAVSEFVPAIQTRLPDISKLLTMAGAMLCLAIFYSGGFGIWLVYRRLRGQPVLTDTNAGCLVPMALAALAAAPIIALSYLNPISQWSESIDSWSRSAGMHDFGLMFVTAVCSLWPYILLAGLYIRGETSTNDNEPTN